MDDKEKHDGPYIQATITVFTDGPKERALHGIDQFCKGLRQQVEDCMRGKHNKQPSLLLK